MLFALCSALEYVAFFICLLVVAISFWNWMCAHMKASGRMRTLLKTRREKERRNEYICRCKCVYALYGSGLHLQISLEESFFYSRKYRRWVACCRQIKIRMHSKTRKQKEEEEEEESAIRVLCTHEYWIHTRTFRIGKIDVCSGCRYDLCMRNILNPVVVVVVQKFKCELDSMYVYAFAVASLVRNAHRDWDKH